MASHHYQFLTRWRMEATPEEVYPIIDDTPSYVRWWPAVWLRVEILDPGDSNGIGNRVRLTTKGWLPYILSWQGTAVEKIFPQRAVFQASGDFEGRGTWTFRPDGSFVDIEYRWEVVADKPLLKYFSFLFRPLFAFNHNWAMARGEESLRLELARRRAKGLEALALIPAPPPPVFLSQRRRRQLGLGEWGGSVRSITAATQPRD
jgi:hypothetical protein